MRLVVAPDVIFDHTCYDPRLITVERLVLQMAEASLVEYVVMTSCLRPGDVGCHGIGMARDYDAVWSQGVTHPAEVAEGAAWAARVRQHADCPQEIDVIWHGPRYHLHVEVDPKRGGFRARMRSLGVISAFLTMLMGCAGSWGPVSGTFGDALMCEGGCTVETAADGSLEIASQNGRILWSGTLSANGVLALGVAGFVVGGPPGAAVGAGVGVIDKASDLLLKDGTP